MDFDTAYKTLNDKQREAVEAINGPVLVIAGPGTGKTQLLSMRVANILRKTDTNARNILCLTFTNKAAVNMRERLQKLTGNKARNVTVKTFHAFAAEIMNSYPEQFWNGAIMGSAPDVVQLDILEDIVSQLPKENPFSLKFDGKYTMIGTALRSISLAKEAGLTPKKLEALIQVNTSYIEQIEPMMIDVLSSSLSYKALPALQQRMSQLPEQPIDAQIAPLLSLSTIIKESLDHALSLDEGTNKTKATGDWKKRWIQTEAGEKGMFKERRKNAKWLAVADIYHRYRQELHHRGYYDYSDMLLEVIVQLEQNASLRSDIQERFEYVLIDEFQDSNAAQLRLAHLVANHHSAENKPNIMAVGDDDQSIYGFNGAELNNMLHFDRTYDEVETIVLTDNYRSSQAILSAADSVIRQSNDRLVTRVEGLKKDLIAKSSFPTAGEIIHRKYQDPDQQLSEVAHDIQKRTLAQPDQTIAVLARRHDSLIALAGQLNQLGVSISYEQDQNILELDIIQQILLICETLQAINEGDERQISVVVSQMLIHPMWRLDHQVLWEIARQNRYEDQWLATMLETEATKQIGEWLLWLAQITLRQNLTIVMEYIIGLRESEFISPIKRYFLEEPDLTNEYIQTLSAIRLLRQLVSEFVPETQPTVVDFLRYIETIRSGKKGISDQSVFVSGDKAVELYSVHKAKGLEFDAVYIIDAVEGDWRPSTNKDAPPANLPLQPPLESYDDYARLMYVAVTRAKHSLFVSSYAHNKTGEEVLSTPLVADIPVEEIALGNTEQNVPILEDSLRWPRLVPSQEKFLLSNVLQYFSINVSNLINFLDVTAGGPATFLERNLLRLPAVKTEYMIHGTAIHAALEAAQKQVNAKGMSLESIKQVYFETLVKENFSRDQLEYQSTEGNKVLEKLFHYFHYTLSKGSTPEMLITGCTVGEAAIGGKLDRVDFIDQSTIRIVDYKTGKPLTNLETKDKTKEVKAWKHKLQLTFYALLAQQHPELSKYKSVEAQMAYVEAGSAKDLLLNYRPTQDEIDHLSQLIQAVYRKVKAYDLPDVTGYETTLSGIHKFEADLLKSA